MALSNVLNYRQPQASAPGFPRPAAVHAVEPLSQARNVLASNTGAAVFHSELSTPAIKHLRKEIARLSAEEQPA